VDYACWLVWRLLGYANECFGFDGLLARQFGRASKHRHLAGCGTLLDVVYLAGM
jgi:hypothetical protein